MRSWLVKVLLVFLVGVVAGFPLMGGMRAEAQVSATAFVVGPLRADADAGSAQEDRIAALEKQVADQAAAIAAAQSAGDNAWMLVSAALRCV